MTWKNVGNFLEYLGNIPQLMKRDQKKNKETPQNIRSPRRE
jgi:hypothetical protein